MKLPKCSRDPTALQRGLPQRSDTSDFRHSTRDAATWRDVIASAARTTAASAATPTAPGGVQLTAGPERAGSETTHDSSDDVRGTPALSTGSRLPRLA